MSISDFLAIPHDQIDYAALGADVLRELATQRSEPYIATSALAELAARRSPEATGAANAILSADVWDRHLFAFAVTALCEIDPERARETMVRLLDTTDDPKVLAAMASCVLSDTESFRIGPGRAFAERLAAKVEAVGPDRFTDLEERASFLARYRR